MTPERSARFAPPRGVAIGVSALILFAILLFGWGVLTSAAVANPASPNGGAVLVSIALDTAIDASVVSLWAIAAFGIGYRLCSYSLPGEYTGEGARITRLLVAVTTIALGIGILGFAAFALAIVSVLNKWSAWTLLLAGVAAVPWKSGDAAAIKTWLRTPDWLAGFACVFAVPVALLFLATTLPPGILWKPLDPHPYDVVSYHLQVPREWYEAGRMMPLPHNSFSYFPMGQEIHDLLLMHLLGGPWAAMYACQLLSAAMTALAVLAVVGTVRATGGGRNIAAASGLLTLCVPWTLMLGSVAYVESGVMLYSTLAVAWGMLALRPLNRSNLHLAHDAAARAADSANVERLSTPKDSAARDAASDASASISRCLALAGLCCGLAGGVKYTALAMTAVPVLVLWPLFAWPTLGRKFLRAWLIGGVACGVAVAPWLVRNAVWTGNPVFPLASGFFGRGPFSAEQVDRYALAHEPPPAERSIVARSINGWHRVAADPQFAYGLTPLSALAVLLAWRSRPARFGAAVLVATGLVWLLFTHDEPRFLAPAIPLAAVMIAVAAAAVPVVDAITLAGMTAVALFGFAWTASTLWPSVDLGRQGLFRTADLTPFEPPELKEARDTGGRFALIGDAQAFFYAMPPGRMKYRGVFDVNVPPGVSLADGWLGEPVDRLRAEGYWVLIAPGELARLSATYAHLPRPTPPFDDPRTAPVVLPPTRMPH